MVAAALAGVSVPAGAVAGPIAVAVLALVAGTAVLLWYLDSSPVLATSTLLVLLVAAWSSVFQGYERLWWLDIAMHVLATGAVAAVVTQALLHHDVVLVGRWPGAVAVLLTVAAGISLSVVWEIAEWWGHTFVDRGVGVGYDDTIGDLAAGLLGSVLSGCWLARGRRVARG